MTMSNTMPAFLRLFLVLGACRGSVAAFGGIHQLPAFAVMSRQHYQVAVPSVLSHDNNKYSKLVLLATTPSSDTSPHLEPVPPEEAGTIIPFYSFKHYDAPPLECFVDSVAVLNGTKYTLGVPCHDCVAFCYVDDESEELRFFDEEHSIYIYGHNDHTLPSIIVPRELPGVELFRTPQVLTMKGLERDDDDDDDDDDNNRVNDARNDNDEDDNDTDDEKVQVEILFTFPYEDQEVKLVRYYTPPLLIIGKTCHPHLDRRYLLSPEESERVRPVLERMFVEFHKDDAVVSKS